MAYPNYPSDGYPQPPLGYPPYGAPPYGYAPPANFSYPTPGGPPPYGAPPGGYASPIPGGASPAPGGYGAPPGGYASPIPGGAFPAPGGYGAPPGGYAPPIPGGASPAPGGYGVPPPGGPYMGGSEGKKTKGKKQAKAKKTKEGKKTKGATPQFNSPGGYAPPATPMGAKAWHAVTSPEQFCWSFNGEQYPESKETRPDCAWAPQKPGYQTDLVTCQEIGKLSVWDAASGQAARTLLAPGCQYPAGIMSGGIELLAASGNPSSSTTVHLFNLNTGATLHRFEKMAGLSCALQSISFFPSSGPADLRLAAVGDSPELRIFDMGTGLQALSIPLTVGSGGGYLRADLDNPGIVFYQTPSYDGKVYMYDTRSPATAGPSRVFLGLRTDQWSPLTFNRISQAGNGRWVSSHHSEILKVWDVGTGGALVTLKGPPNFIYGGITDACVVALRKGGTGDVWMLNSALSETTPPHFSLSNSQMIRNSPAVYAATMSNKGIWCCSNLGILEGTWKPSPAGPTSSLPPQVGAPSGASGFPSHSGMLPPPASGPFPLAAAPASSVGWGPLATPSQFTWKFSGENYPESKGTRGDCIWSPEEPGYQTDLVTCHEKGEILIWNSEHGQIVQRLSAPECQYLAGTKSGDRELLATAGHVFVSSSATIHLFDLITGASLHRFEKIAGLSCELSSVSFLPSSGPADLHLLGVANEGSGDTTVRVFDMGTGMQVRTVTTGTSYGGFVTADIANPGMFFFLSTHGGPTCYFDSRVSSTASPVRKFLGHANNDRPVYFNRMTATGPSGSGRKISACAAGLLKVWDVGTGSALVSMKGDDLIFGGARNDALVAVRQDANAQVWMLNGALTDDAPPHFILQNSQLNRNHPAVWAARMTNRSIFLGSTVGILEGTWGLPPARLW